jgi:2-dehydro-3-deoxygluconokinase
LLAALAGEAELLFGNHRDIALMTGEVFAGDDRDRQAVLAAFRRFPSLRLIASTRREVESAAQQSLSARLDMRDAAFVSDAVAMTGIIDRIGAGDAFAAGVLHGVFMGEAPARIVELGLCAAVQKHFIAGDMWIGCRDDLLAEAGDISR